jgi:hypothetical protein
MTYAKIESEEVRDSATTAGVSVGAIVGTISQSVGAENFPALEGSSWH